MAQRDADTINSLLKKVYSILSAGDDVNKGAPTSQSFLSFVMPGIPLAISNLNFGFLAMTPEQHNAAMLFSDVVNVVPEFNKLWREGGGRVYDVYSQVLDNIVLPQDALSAKEKADLAAAMDLLYVRATVVALDGTDKSILIDSPLVERYNVLSQLYATALNSYNAVRSGFILSPDDPKMQLAWSLDGPRLRSDLSAAWNVWQSGGKNSVERARATVGLLTARGAAGYWQRLREAFDLAKFIDPVENVEYRLTKYFPSQFWDSAHSSSWMRVEFSEKDIHAVSHAETTTWGGGFGAGFGMWSFGGGASRTDVRNSSESDTKDMRIAFEMAQIPLRRSWFDASVFDNRGWKLAAGFGSVVSDGDSPPSGLMPILPVAIIVARNLELKLDTSSQKDTYAFSQVSASASAGWGPFSIRGNYSKMTTDTTHDFVSSGTGITCPGMQLIGFICRRLPKSPNPSPNLIFP